MLQHCSRCEMLRLLELLPPALAGPGSTPSACRPPSLCRLENFGNTCYCNSVLQTLYFCRPFRWGLLLRGACTFQHCCTCGPDLRAWHHEAGVVCLRVCWLPLRAVECRMRS